MDTFSERMINPIDVELLTSQVSRSRPFPHFRIDNFLNEEFAREIAKSYPTFEEADRLGLQFRTVNEQQKIQVTDASNFAEPVARLNRALQSTLWLETISTIMSIPDLVADPDLSGGGMHLTGPGGRLDVHVDFNVYTKRGLYRRLNLLIYLNPEWKSEWGGTIELWDADVRSCCHSFEPMFNRC
ncbi:MAG: 2OG-Fe(II) oxygenase, partial [Gammaproteobacteria bacterium]